MPQRPSADAPVFPAGLESALRFLASRRLSHALLLLAVGHRPFLFLSGQMLQVGGPLIALWTGSREVFRWATFLSHPEVDRLLLPLLNPDPGNDTLLQ